jgi:hypothetical protein
MLSGDWLRQAAGWLLRTLGLEPGGAVDLTVGGQGGGRTGRTAPPVMVGLLVRKVVLGASGRVVLLEGAWV